jgi:hypothetical protein
VKRDISGTLTLFWLTAISGTHFLQTAFVPWLIYHDSSNLAHQVGYIQVSSFVVRKKKHRSRHIIRRDGSAKWLTGERDYS